MTIKECGCPAIVDREWEGKTFNWKDRTFFAQDVRFFFRAPMDIDQKVARAGEMIEQRGYMLEEPLTVLIEESQFRGRVLVGILPPEGTDPHVVVFPDVSVVARVFQRREARLPVKQLNAWRKSLEEGGRKVGAMYLWHVTCPNCSRLEGFKTVVFAQVR
jgi:hypothetical protein